MSEPASDPIQVEKDSGDQSSNIAKPTGTTFRNLRIWPAVLLLVFLWGLRIVPGLSGEVSMMLMMAGFMGPLVCAGLIVLWWLFFSRATMKERAAGFIGLAIILVVTSLLADKTIRGFGTMLYAVPWGISGFAIALICLSRKPSFGRTWLALFVSLICFGFWDLVRTDEIRGDFRTVRSWRWEPTAEDLFLQELAERSQQSETVSSRISQEAFAEPEWPEFRGAGRRGRQAGVALAEDWSAQPPVEIWRISVGPGWSSFSVAGKQLFTQEQRGDNEVVVCYDADSGAEVWVHEDESRFWEAVGGAGPRATPTLDKGRLFALGANGLLNRLDPLTGELVWQRDINQDADRKPPTWGYASSPLIVDDLVIVHAGGEESRGVLAYDAETGELRWTSPAGDHSYSSPQLSDIRGVRCVLMLTNAGITFVDPADGSLLGKHDWQYDMYRVVQPLVVDDSHVLLGTAMGTGTQKIEVNRNGRELTTKEAWISRRMNPYYNDYVAHEGYLYGFDNNIFACVDLADGERKWKRGRYGNGQVLLIPDANQLLVLSEDGELVLLKATPEKHVELTRHPALNGRTWNHPVLVKNRLYVRNAQEAACFEVPLKES